VLVLANGSVPRVTVSTDYALSTLSSIFPKTLANNIAFLFTNVTSPLHFNFSRDTLPDVLRDAPLFLFNNPIALQKKYLRFRNDPNMKIGRAGFRKAVKVGEENALETLVDLFLDGLEPQPTTETTSPYGKPQAMVADTHTRMNQAVAKEAEHPAVSSSTYMHLESYTHWELGCGPKAHFQSKAQHRTATEDREVHYTQSGQLEGNLEETLGALRRRRRRESETS